MSADLTERLVPESALRDWIGDRLPGEGPFVVERVTTGSSNEMFRLERCGHRALLRRPPRAGGDRSGAVLEREHRILGALEGSGLPHSRSLALCLDSDVIGAPFALLEWVDGVRLYDGLPAALDDSAARQRVAEELFDSLAALHNIDWEAAGLGDLGRPDGFTARQVDRWMHQLHATKGRDLPDAEKAAEWLAANVPVMQRPALIHGDYGLHNVLYSAGTPVELIAVVDWETATIGDPLLDIGYLLGLWLEGADEQRRWFSTALPYDVAGFPGRAELAARYAAAAGLELDAVEWYRAMAQLKVAVILEGLYARWSSGGSDNPALERLRLAVPNHAAYALAITRGEA